MPILLQLQKLLWKGDGGWNKSVFASFFGWPEDREFVEKKCVLGHPTAWATSYCLLPDTLWLRASKNAFKVGSVKFANSLSPPSSVKKVRTGKAAKGLKRCRANVKGVNNPARIAQYPLKLKHLLCLFSGEISINNKKYHTYQLNQEKLNPGFYSYPASLVWLVQILDVLHCVLLLQHRCCMSIDIKCYL